MTTDQEFVAGVRKLAEKSPYVVLPVDDAVWLFRLANQQAPFAGAPHQHDYVIDAQTLRHLLWTIKQQRHGIDARRERWMARFEGGDPIQFSLITDGELWRWECDSLGDYDVPWGSHGQTLLEVLRLLGDDEGDLTRLRPVSVGMDGLTSGQILAVAACEIAQWPKERLDALVNGAVDAGYAFSGRESFELTDKGRELLARIGLTT